MNNRLLQTLDVLTIMEKGKNNEEDYPRCADCRARLEEGSEVIAHTYLDGGWHIEDVCCPVCHQTDTEAVTGGVERVTVDTHRDEKRLCHPEWVPHTTHPRRLRSTQTLHGETDAAKGLHKCTQGVPR